MCSGSDPKFTELPDVKIPICLALTGGPLDGKYTLDQFHCHWGETDDEGSEHTLNGVHFAGEFHLVHWNSKYKSVVEAAHHSDGICVMGMFVKPGNEHEELNKIVALLKNLEYKGQSAKCCPLNFELFIPHYRGYYTYQGSFTTPPCAECVIWIIFKESIEISSEQLEAFRNLKCYCAEDERPSDKYGGFVKSNIRPTVPLGQREIWECTS